jgi:hypothetical protein
MELLAEKNIPLSELFAEQISCLVDFLLCKRSTQWSVPCTNIKLFPFLIALRWILGGPDRLDMTGVRSHANRLKNKSTFIATFFHVIYFNL